MNKARLVIYRSENGRTDWQPVKQADVPEWVKDPVTMGRLVAGEQCMDTGEGNAGSAWYRAKRVVNERERALLKGVLQTVH